MSTQNYERADEATYVFGETAWPSLVRPHGGELRELYLPADMAADIRRTSGGLKSLTLSHRHLCDLELLLDGAFSPLTGYLSEADYAGVVDRSRLADGTLWSMPLTLDVSEEDAGTMSAGTKVILRDSQGTPIAILEVSELFRPDKRHEAAQVFGTTDPAHPGVAALNAGGPVYVGGRVHGLHRPGHHSFIDLRMTPRSMRDWFVENGWRDIVAFQTRNPMHQAHVELTRRAMDAVGGKLLLHPVVGQTKEGDVDAYTRVRCYRALLSQYPRDAVKLSVLPLAMRMAGPREALWHALVRQNFGVSHFIVGRDHAGPGKDASGRPFYSPLQAQELLASYKSELDIHVLAFPPMVFSQCRSGYVPSDDIRPGEEVSDVSGTQLRQHLRDGKPLPDWFTYPEVEKVLRDRFPSPSTRGFAIFFTGLSGAGKSTIAQAVAARILESTQRNVSILDGDEVRRRLSAGLGFSRPDRSANVHRIAYVASEIVRHGGIAICAPIAPYADDRTIARQLVEQHGGFIEIHVGTPLAVCEERDPKGLYAQARAGTVKHFTGISDPYEVPEHPDVRLDGSYESPQALAASVIAHVAQRGWLEPEAG